MNFADKVRKTIAAKGQAPFAGKVPGKAPANPKKDNKTIPAQSGEYVIPAAVVKAHGKGYFDSLVQNTLGSTKVPAGSPSKGYWMGGQVQGEPGGPGGRWRAPMQNLVGRMPQGGKSPWGRPRSDIAYQEAVGGPDDNSEVFGGRGGGPQVFLNRDWSPGMSDMGHVMYNPFNMFQTMQPGMPWSPTMIPTSYDFQGYPMAVPTNYVATNSSDPTGLLHAGQKIQNR